MNSTLRANNAIRLWSGRLPRLSIFILLAAPLSLLISVGLASIVFAYKSSDVMTDVRTTAHDLSVSGRVVNQAQKPIGGVTVLLWEKDGDLSMETKTSAAGVFFFDHKPCGTLCLEITPDPRMKLASALVEDLPGGETRKMIVELKSGYLVTGRITHDGKGLKGLVVRATALGVSDRRTKVHGGGVAETGKNGTFTLILTGGEKKLFIVNDKYPDYARHVEKTITVSDDTHLGQIDVP